MTNEKRRIEWVDYLKAFACFLVVLGHLLQSLQKANLDAHTSITLFINFFIYLFHMPLFMCMSGFLYCQKNEKFTFEKYKKFEHKKIINLLIPYVTFYLLFIGINMLFARSVNRVRGIEDILNIFNKPMAPYWFLYSLLSIFIVVPLIEKIFKYNKIRIFICFVFLKILSFLGKTNIYFIDTIMAYAIYFYFGAFVNKESRNKKNKSVTNVFLVIGYVVLSLIYYKYADWCSQIVLQSINLFFAVSGIWICIRIFREINLSYFLNSFKKYTFQIYLTHTIFAAGVRIFLLKLNVTNYFLHLIIGLIASLYIPVIMSLISKKIKYTEFFFYPVKTIEDLKERKKKYVREEA